jgi:integrase
MGLQKNTTQYPGVRYRVHKFRKYNGKLDRYYFLRYRINGRQIEEGIGYASEGWNPKKASNLLADLRKNHLTGEGPQTLAEKRVLENEKREVAHAAKDREAREAIPLQEYFLKSYFPEAQTNKKQDSWRRENNLFNLWINPVIGKMPFKNVRPFHLEKIKKNMADAGQAPRSIQYALAVVRQVVNHAIRNEVYSGDNPARKVTKPKIDNRRMRFLTHEEADLLLDNLMARSQQLHDMALLSLHCGLRAGEIFDLTWGCVNFTNDSIILMNTKSGKNRTAYMTHEVRDMLSAKNLGQPTDLVFAGRNRDKIKEISNAFNRAVDELGFNAGVVEPRIKVYFHTLRHTYASWLVQRGVDLYTVKELMGHSTLAMTERYSHLRKENLTNAVKIFEEGLKKADTGPLETYHHSK